MSATCKNGRCGTPSWMRLVLLAAGFYQLLFAVWAICWPNQWFDWLGFERPNHPMLWQAVGAAMGVLGVSLILAARNPTRHWGIALLAWLKFTLGIIGFSVGFMQGSISPQAIWMMVVNDLVWWLPFSVILWGCLRAHIGIPLARENAYSIDEAASTYRLSTGQTLAEASESAVLAMVFLRHFGCTFTRRILRGLEEIEAEAKQHGAELVLVHMLQSGRETEYLGETNGVTRIADPRCELYRAFGLGKGGFLELFGPKVWMRTTSLIFKGCGVGHLAGDGMQMPGAFLFHKGCVISAQPARSASDLPDLPRLFENLPGSGTC